jgi:hypothetical protein
MAMSKVAGARINPEIWEQFKLYCLRKHGKLHSALGTELERALLYYMQHVPPTPSPEGMSTIQQDEHVDDMDGMPKVNPRLVQELETIVAEIAKDCEPGAQLPRTVLEAKIVRGLGPCGRKRINDRITWLMAFGVVEPDPQFPVGKVYIVRKLSLWTGGTHGGPDPAGGLRGQLGGAHRLQV